MSVWGCVYVSVTLSVNSPTGQTPQRIFTADSLKDADFRKDVLFGGLDDEYGSKSIKTPIFRPEKAFQDKYAKNSNRYISSDLCIRLTWNLTGSSGQQQRLRGWSIMVVKQFQDGRFWTGWTSRDQKWKFPIFKMADGRHFENRYIAISQWTRT